MSTEGKRESKWSLNVGRMLSMAMDGREQVWSVSPGRWFHTERGRVSEVVVLEQRSNPGRRPWRMAVPADVMEEVLDGFRQCVELIREGTTDAQFRGDVRNEVSRA